MQNCTIPGNIDPMTNNLFEIQSIREILPYLDDQTHLFLDIDNTLLTSVSEFGSERWERFMIDHFISQGIPEDEAVSRGCHLWKAVQTVSEIQWVEDETQAIIQAFHEKKRPVFAITARDLELRTVTENQLASLGLQFSDCKVPFPLEPGGYFGGVFYCGDVPKGTVLKNYLELHDCSRLVLVDDYRSHLEIAAKMLDQRFIGLRYAFLDKRKSNYNPCEITKLMGKIFTHRAASQFLLRGIEN